MSVQIILNKNKKFEVVTIGKNGNLLDTTNPQQYNRRSGAHGKIIATMKEYGCIIKYVQDNTTIPASIWCIYSDKRKPVKTEIKPNHKPYSPKQSPKK